MIRTWMMTAALALSTALPAASQNFDIDTMSEADRAAFGEAVRDYLLANPQLLRDWIGVLQDHEAEAEAREDIELVADNAAALFDDEGSWAGGNLEGDVTLVEFLDYRCSFCRRAHPEVVELVSSDGNIRKIIKEFPILGEESVEAARFAISVLQIEGNDAYKVISDRLMTHRGAFTRDALSQIADGEGLDADAVVAHMDDGAVTEVLEANYALAQRMNISGTPSFVLGDAMLRGYVPLESMRDLVADYRSR
ncbi:MAG: DsbA family protein [Pseudomonadota bacterium]